MGESGAEGRGEKHSNFEHISNVYTYFYGYHFLKFYWVKRTVLIL